MTDHRPRGPYNPLNNDVDDYCDAGGRSSPSTTFSSRGPADGTALSPAEQEALLDAIGAILDILGIFDPSPTSDGASAILSFSRGDQIGGWLSVVAIIPFLGDIAKAGKFPSYIQKIKKAIETAKQNPRVRKSLEPSMRQLKKGIDLISEIKGPLADKVQELKKVIDDFLGQGMFVTKVVRKGFRAGMTFDHFEATLSIAKKNNVIIAFRNTNEACLEFIKKGFPPKPGAISAKTKNGLATAVSDKEKEEALRAGYWILDEQGNAIRSIGLKHPQSGKQLTEMVPGFSVGGKWTPAAGQVIDPSKKLPLTGDYDLMAIIDPADYKSNMVAIVSENGRKAASFSNPKNNKVIGELNEAMGEKRVMHGAAEYFDDVGEAGDVTLFFPDGKSTLLLEKGEPVKAFYEQIGRYHKGNPPPTPSGPAGFPGWQKNATVIKGGKQ